MNRPYDFVVPAQLPRPDGSVGRDAVVMLCESVGGRVVGESGRYATLRGASTCARIRCQLLRHA